jgi:FdhD protein
VCVGARILGRGAARQVRHRGARGATPSTRVRLRRCDDDSRIDERCARRRTPNPEFDTPTLRRLFKDLFARGERYKDTGGIHAAALTDGETLLYHAEDIGRHNAVDKVIGAAVLDGRSPEDLTLLVTGRISGELAFKAARARIATVATPSIPSTIAVDIAKAARMTLVGRR